MASKTSPSNADDAGTAPAPLIDVPCNGCGADDFTVVATVSADHEYVGVIDDAYALRPFRFVRCRRCGLVYLNPRPDDREILKYYPPEYGCFAQCPPKGALMRGLYRVMVALKRRELLPRLPEQGVLLDFGCGNGHWLVALKPYAGPEQRLIGIDPCEGPVEQLRRQGVEAYVGTDENLLEIVEPESVDLILFNHVIEHVPDPKRTLRRLATVLKPGGEIRGVTPNVDALDQRWMGPWWAGWHAPRHFVLFDRESLARYAADAGLELVQTRYELEGANHWSVGWHSWLARKIGWRASSGRYRMPIYPLLLMPALVLGALQKAFGKTSVIGFVMRKPRGQAS